MNTPHYYLGKMRIQLSSKESNLENSDHRDNFEKLPVNLLWKMKMDMYLGIQFYLKLDM